MSGQRIFATIVVAVVVGVAGAAIVMLGPPSEERERRLDQRRVGDLSQLSRSVQAYVDRHKALPRALEVLSQEPGVQLDRDPVSGAEYEYRPLDDSRFELCARFERASEDAELRTWSHGAGRQCFVQRVRAPGPG